jgi:hypothetical protein
VALDSETHLEKNKDHSTHDVLLLVLDTLDDELVVDLYFVRFGWFPGGHRDGSTYDVVLEEALDEEVLIVLHTISLGLMAQKNKSGGTISMVITYDD